MFTVLASCLFLLTEIPQTCANMYYDEKQPSNEPTTEPTFIPSHVPTEEPIPNSPKNLYFVCQYKDNKSFIENYMSMNEYADLLLKTILTVISTIGDQSLKYADAVYNPSFPWKKAAIENFDICNIFDMSLVYSNVDCPLGIDYFDTLHAQSTFVAMASFDIITKCAIRKYQKYITKIMTSDIFMETCNELMNNAIQNNTEKEYNNFEIVQIKILIGLKDIIHTTEVPSSTKQNVIPNNKDSILGISFSNITIVIAFFSSIIGVLVILMILATIFYCKYKKQVAAIKQQTEKQLRLANDMASPTSELYDGTNTDLCDNILYMLNPADDIQESEQKNNAMLTLDNAITLTPSDYPTDMIINDLVELQVINEANETHNVAQIDMHRGKQTQNGNEQCSDLSANDAIIDEENSFYIGDEEHKNSVDNDDDNTFVINDNPQYVD